MGCGTQQALLAQHEQKLPMGGMPVGQGIPSTPSQHPEPRLGWHGPGKGRLAPHVSPSRRAPTEALPAEISSERTVSTFRDCWPQLVIVRLASVRPVLPVQRDPERPVWAACRQRGQSLAVLPTVGSVAQTGTRVCWEQGPGRGGWKHAIQFPFWNAGPSPTSQLSPPFLFMAK